MNVKRCSYRGGKRRGFTLIEIMIVVVIVAVLAVIALPSFMSQVRASRRAEAISTLSQVLQAQERWRANCPCYAGSLTAVNSGCPVTDCAIASGLAMTFNNPRYTITMPTLPLVASPNTYTIRATPVGDQGNDRVGAQTCNPLEIRVTNGNPVNDPPACWRQ